MPATGRANRTEIVLGIESSTRYGSVAVAGGSGTLGEILLYHPRSYSERLLPAVDDLLRQVGITPAELAAVAVSIGPGSFTGLRIGAAAAKGLAFARHIPLYGIPTLEVLAGNVPPTESVICALLDARRGELFYARYRYRRGQLVRTHRESVIKADSLAELLPEKSLLIGELPVEDTGHLQVLRRRGVHLAPPHLSFPRAAVVAALGREKMLAGEPSEGDALRPLYLRPSDAEANLALSRSRARHRPG